MDVVSKYKNVFFFILLAVFIFVMFGFFFGDKDDGLRPALLSTGSAQAADIAERELLSILLDLRRIELREEIFSDRVFISLKDFSQDLVPEPVGRKNPFAPLFSTE